MIALLRSRSSIDDGWFTRSTDSDRRRSRCGEEVPVVTSGSEVSAAELEGFMEKEKGVSAFRKS